MLDVQAFEKKIILVQEPLFLSVINAKKENMQFPVNILKPALCNVIFFTFKHFVVFQINNEFIFSIKSVRFNKERYLSLNTLSAFYRP